MKTRHSRLKHSQLSHGGGGHVSTPCADAPMFSVVPHKRKCQSPSPSSFAAVAPGSTAPQVEVASVLCPTATSSRVTSQIRRPDSRRLRRLVPTSTQKTVAFTHSSKETWFRAAWPFYSVAFPKRASHLFVAHHLWSLLTAFTALSAKLVRSNTSCTNGRDNCNYTSELQLQRDEMI